MSNFNYIDGMPVKISERFKPLPKVFQIPQAIVNKIQQSDQHYYELPQLSYDFQLEKKVLAQITNWRCLRQNMRELREKRQQMREELKLRAIEQQHKQMLGAVNYPDAEELSTDDSDEQDLGDKPQLMPEDTKQTEIYFPGKSALCSFHNILKPIILPQSSSCLQSVKDRTHNSTSHSRNKSSSSFNYKDFEEDTSSPFDNIELKTINDLDILAQVLRHSQLNSKGEIKGELLEGKTNSEDAGTITKNELEFNKKEIAEPTKIINKQNELNQTFGWREDDNNLSQYMNIPANYSNPTNYLYCTTRDSLGQTQLQGGVANRSYVISESSCNTNTIGGQFELQMNTPQANAISHHIGANTNTYAEIPLPTYQNSSQNFPSNKAAESEVKN